MHTKLPLLRPQQSPHRLPCRLSRRPWLWWLWLCLGLISCQQSAPPAVVPTQTLLEQIREHPQLQQLAAALPAELAQKLDDPNANYSFFAPINAAFTEARFAEVNAPLPNAVTLPNILRYHLVERAITSQQIRRLLEDHAFINMRTVLSPLERLFIVPEASSVGFALSIGVAVPGFDTQRWGEVRFVTLDIPATNGTLHIIERLLLPSTLAERVYAALSPTLQVPEAQRALLLSLRRFSLDMGLIAQLRQPTAFTMFLPSPAALQQLSTEQIAFLAANPEALQAILRYHLIEGLELSSDDLAERQSLRSAQGETIRISQNADGKLQLNANASLSPSLFDFVALSEPRRASKGRSVLWQAGLASSRLTPNSLLLEGFSDVRTRNGVMHNVNRLLIPPSLAWPD